MHGEAEARKATKEARQAVIKACADLREAEMFLDAFKSHDRSAVGGGVLERPRRPTSRTLISRTSVRMCSPARFCLWTMTMRCTRRVVSWKQGRRCKRQRSSSGRLTLGTGSMRGFSLALRVI